MSPTRYELINEINNCDEVIKSPLLYKIRIMLSDRAIKDVQIMRLLLRCLVESEKRKRLSVEEKK